MAVFGHTAAPSVAVRSNKQWIALPEMVQGRCIYRKMEKPMSLKDAIKKFTDSVSDPDQPEVTTYSGKLEQVIDAGTGQLKWDSFKPNNSKLTLVAATLIRPNMNTVNFRAEALEQRISKRSWSCIKRWSRAPTRPAGPGENVCRSDPGSRIRQLRRCRRYG